MLNRSIVAASAAAAFGLVAGAHAAVITGPSSSATPFLVPTNPMVTNVVSIMTVGDSVNFKPDGVTPYRAVGIMDGLGAYDNGNGTFSVLMNHEIGASINAARVATGGGIPRAHGNAGAFVSLWTINKSDLSVVKVEDFLANNTSVFLSNNNPGTGTAHTAYLPGSTTLFSRLCSADLAAPGAYHFVDGSGNVFGTTARIFQSGEESGGTAFGPTNDFATSVSVGGPLSPEARVDFGRQFAFVATDDPNTPGNDARTAYELPHAGLFSWENNLASPLAQRKTIVAGMDDGSPIGQVYFWVGDKQQTGNVVERAGLTRQSTNDNLFVVKVPSLLTVDGGGIPLEDRSAPVGGVFQLVKSGNNGDASHLTFDQLEADSDSKGAAQFLRPEDGQWDPTNPSHFYFTTTDRYDQVKDGVGATIGRSRLYRMEFSDILNPELGGNIVAMLDGTEAGQMFDNMTIDSFGNIILQEDPGNQDHNAKVWHYNPDTDMLIELLEHDVARFGDVGPIVPATSPFTRDEESSGVIDVSDILGPGWFLATVQAHGNTTGLGELAERGQFLAFQIQIPEPATASLGAIVAGLLASRRRRRA